ncbi:hypothetical protein SDC9_113269 [bioreactor metagenome]|uniref:Peptidase M50 domain-containing protein n=1 Tax=bioreactor metagenome TaxID=1076179 RepID=A0A645BME9_9ZZZZ
MKITFKNNLYTSYLQDIFIALSGPFFNLLAALCAMPFVDRNNYIECFAGLNLILFFLNLLPVSVLDGGRTFNAFLCLFFDPFKARKITNLLSVFFIFLLNITGLYVLCQTKFNVSLLLIGIWLSVGLIKQKVENT